VRKPELGLRHGQSVPLGFELAEQHQQLMPGQQPLIERFHPHQALADGGLHLFFYEGDFLFSIGLLAPGPEQALLAELLHSLPAIQYQRRQWR
jgi:hypothetical protein